MPTQLMILGCGTSTGVPLLHCKCRVCRSKNPKNQRLRASAWVLHRGKHLLIDTSTDLRAQALRAKIPRLDAVLYTHPHADHVHGIDELRSFNFAQGGQRLPLFGNEWVERELTERFPYIFKPRPVEGGGIPLLDFHLGDASQPSWDVAGIPVTPIPTRHGSQECVGFRFDSIAYVTDCSYIPPSSLERLRGVRTLVLDCLRLANHPTHFNLDQALQVVQEVGPKRTYLTHLGHDFDASTWVKQRRRLVSSDVPDRVLKTVELAHDGLKLIERNSP